MLMERHARIVELAAVQHRTTADLRGAGPSFLARHLKIGKVVFSDIEMTVFSLTAVSLRGIADGRDVAVPQPGPRMNSLHSQQRRMPSTPFRCSS